MNNKQLNLDIEYLLSNRMKKNNKRVLSYVKYESNKYLIRFYNEYKKDKYSDFSIRNPHLVVNSIFEFYKGEAKWVNNSLLPSGKGEMCLVADISDDDLDPFVGLESYEGIWENGFLKDGKFRTETEPFWINYPITKTKLYDFYLNIILGADGNIGKRIVSSEIIYNGSFDENMEFSDNKGTLLIKYRIDYVRQCEAEEGTMSLCGSFKDGSIVYGEYDGPHFGFNVIYDKPAKYRGNFKDNVFEGFGILEYNFQGGYIYQDRINCKYLGNFKDGLKSGNDAIEEAIDENNVRIKFKKCVYENNLLKEFDEVVFYNDKEGLFGFEESYKLFKKAIYKSFTKAEAYLSDKASSNEINIPEDISYFFSSGSLEIQSDLRTLIYKNYGQDNINGTYIFLFGRIILNGTFLVLDEMTHEISLETWRYGYLVDTCTDSLSQREYSALYFIQKIIYEFIETNKEVGKRLIASGVPNGSSYIEQIMIFFVINFLTICTKEGVNYLKDSVGNKKEVLKIFESCIKSIYGEIEEIRADERIRNEENSMLDAYFYFRGGIRAMEHYSNKEKNNILYHFKKKKEVYLRTKEWFDQIIKILSTNQSVFIKNKLFSIDSLIREYDKLKQIIDRLDGFNISKDISYDNCSSKLTENECKMINETLNEFSEVLINLLEQLNIRFKEWGKIY